jgi:hypothetical protein
LPFSVIRNINIKFLYKKPIHTFLLQLALLGTTGSDDEFQALGQACIYIHIIMFVFKHHYPKKIENKEP